MKVTSLTVTPTQFQEGVIVVYKKKQVELFCTTTLSGRLVPLDRLVCIVKLRKMMLRSSRSRLFALKNCNFQYYMPAREIEFVGYNR